MIRVLHRKIAVVLLALASLSGCAGDADIRKARDDSAAALRVATEAQARAEAASRTAIRAAEDARAAQQAAESRQAITAATTSAMPAAPARPVAAAEPAVAPTEPAVAPAEPAVAPAVSGDAVAGKSRARRCLACHSFDEGGGHKMGPNLFGVFGRTAGSAAGFRYGDDLKNAGFVWDAEKLAAYICDSPEAIRQLTGNAGARTKMARQRVCGDDAANVAAYLKSLK